jgi:serine/threonine-protein kinase
LPETFGAYVVHEELGSGGMATVHRAELEGIEGFSKQVALKRMLPQLAMHKQVVESFVREGRLASFLHHANIAQTIELGKVDDVYFIAMELVTGRNLGDIQKKCLELGEPLPLELTLNILNQLCDALEYAHDLTDEAGEPLGIIHRDVSPVNIIVADSGVVKLIDFGIAKAQAAGLKTNTFSVKGKFAYMAPEYAFMNKIDARADLFAVAVIAYELMSNRTLFTGTDDMDTMLRLRTLVIPKLSQVNPKIPQEIEDIIMTGLAREPDERWQRASAMRSALATVTQRLGKTSTNTALAVGIEELFTKQRAATVPPVTAESSQVRMEQPPEVKKRRRTWLVGALLFVVACAGVGAYLAMAR